MNYLDSKQNNVFHYLSTCANNKPISIYFFHSCSYTKSFAASLGPSHKLAIHQQTWLQCIQFFMPKHWSTNCKLPIPNDLFISPLFYGSSINYSQPPKCTCIVTLMWHFIEMLNNLSSTGFSLSILLYVCSFLYCSAWMLTCITIFQMSSLINGFRHFPNDRY